MFWFSIDLDELPDLNANVRWFGHNRLALISVEDRDYGGPGDGSIREKISAKLRRDGVTETVDRILLNTIPKVAGYVFNPVNFYLCYGADDRMVALVAEVRNTFGEMHHYVVRPEPSAARGPGAMRFRIPKEFFVSPFFEVKGDYDMRLQAADNRFAITINLLHEDRAVFTATMKGRGVEMTSRRVFNTVCRMPLFAATIMLRIHGQAWRLAVRKRLALLDVPEPSHPNTIPARRSSLWRRLRSSMIRRMR
jgi:DUF1365 family protein